MAKILALDVGLSTGFALVDSAKFPNGGVVEEGTLQVCDLDHLVKLARNAYIIAEMPLQVGHAGELQLQLRIAADAVRAYTKPDLEITAAVWKRYRMIVSAPLPVAKEGVTRTKHSKDALRVALWYLRIFKTGEDHDDKAL